MSDVPADVQADRDAMASLFSALDSVFSGTSEYASQYATVSTETPAAVAAVEDARPAGLPPAKAAPVSFSSSADAAAGQQADRFISEYSAWTAVARENARPSSRIATAAAEAAQTRTAKRRGSIAAQEAAEVAQRRQAEQQAAAAEHDFPEAAELKRRVSFVAQAAAAKATQVVTGAKETVSPSSSTVASAPAGFVVLGEDTSASSSSWVSEYDGRFQTPAYLTSMEKAAAAAADAAIELKRAAQDTCSEYLARFTDFSKNDMADLNTGRKAAHQVGECMDWTAAEAETKRLQELAQTLTAETSSDGVQSASAFGFTGRKYAWVSEYGASFKDFDPTQSARVAGVSASDTNAAAMGDCFDWDVPDQKTERRTTPAPGASRTGVSTYSADYARYDPAITGRIEAIRPRASQVDACLDWAASLVTEAAATPAAAGADDTLDDDWVVVEHEDKRQAAPTPRTQAVIPGWGSKDSSDRMYTTYDWDYDGAWKQYAPTGTKASASASASGAEDRVAPVAGEEKAVQEHVHRLVDVAGVSKESASELFVAEKTLPMFATGSEYQKRYSVPAAHRQRAVASAMKVQKAARDCLTKVTAPSKRGATGLAAPHFPATVQNTIPRTTYQSAFGSKRMVGLPVRIRMLAAKQK